MAIVESGNNAGRLSGSQFHPLSRLDVLSREDLISTLRIQRQAAAVCVLLRFFRFGVLALEVGECHVQRFVTESPDEVYHELLC